MKKLILLTMFLSSISCASLSKPNPEIEVVPTASLRGCEDFATNRNDYLLCTSNLKKLWESRENSEVTLTVIEERRFNNEWMLKTYLHCRYDFCDKFSLPERSPTFWVKVKDTSWTGSMGIVMGIVIGAGL